MPDTLNRAAAAVWRWLYSDILGLLAPYALARWWWRGRREPLYRHAVAERFGRYRDPPMQADVWLHAVSLGETRAATALLAALRAARPGLVVLLTHGTATGRAAGAALLRPGDRQAWLPWDTPGSVHRFYLQHRPRVGVLMETEVWPNLLHGAHDAAVPMVLANARMSERSLRRSDRASLLLRPALRSLALVLAQTDADAARLRAAGAEAAGVRVAGNLKFDVDPDPALQAQGRCWRAALGRPVVVAASTREGEEAPLLDAWLRQASTWAPGDVRPLLLVVPRHPQRFDAVWAAIAAVVGSAARRSDWVAQPPPSACDVDVWLGDSVGEMPLYYGCADAALLGGSYAPFGGQNLIEAAACGCPVIAGPSTHNFADAAELAIADGAAARVDDFDAAVALCRDWLCDPAALDTRAGAARRYAASYGGAARRMAAAIETVLVRATGLPD